MNFLPIMWISFHLRPEEFEKYKIGENTTITFCMRELRAILNFAESMNINISANFDTAGKYESFMFIHLKNRKIQNSRPFINVPFDSFVYV